MISRRAALLNVLVLGGLAGSACRRGRKGAPTRWRRLDTDNDGTMAEAKKAAGALFDWLDRDRDFVRQPLSCRVGGGALDCSRADLRPPHKLDVQFSRIQLSRNGTLDRRELRGRVDAKEFAAADPDKDGTLTKDEYFTIVEKRSKAVDPDNDGTVSAAKLRTKAGRALLRLLVF
jgi:hypothetical protein